jgi:predicted transposase YbfD/YdcC
MACGARSLYAIAQWGRDHREAVCEALGIGRLTTPDSSTLHRILRRLDVGAFESVLGRWLSARGLQAGEAVAIDGKTLRGIHGDPLPGVHLVAAFGHDSGIVLPQEAAPGKGQELAAAKAVLARLDLQGHVVTGDALLAQRGLCAQVVKGGHYLLRVKANQPTLHEGIALLFASGVEPSPPVRETGKRGGRREERELVASTALNEWAAWPHLAQVAQLVSSRTQGGVTTQETHYLITSLSAQEADPGRLLQLSRGHWGIENRLHWVRDVTFDEDRCQVRSGAAPQAMAALRNTVIGALRCQGASNIAAALRSYAAHPRRALALVTSQ